MHVVDHTAGTEMSETRNVLKESARIARGKISALTELPAEDFDALIVPGTVHLLFYNRCFVFFFSAVIVTKIRHRDNFFICSTFIF